MKPEISGLPATAAHRLLQRIVRIEAHEVNAVLLAFAYFFCVLCSYYIIRPIRDDMGVTVGSDGLQRLFVIVFFVMLGAVPLFGWVVSRFAKRQVAPVIYAFFILDLAAFWFLLWRYGVNSTIASVFFVWVSVFNLFVVSLFWSVMADLWSSSAAKRLYGLIAAGGSAGAFAGPLITQSLVHQLGATNLLLVSAVFLGGAMICIAGLRELIGRVQPDSTRDSASAGLIDGALHVFQDRYLFRIAAWVLLANLISTFFYFEQARIVGEAMANRADRVQLFARMDLAVSLITILAQIFLTANVMQRVGIGISVAALATSATLGLCALAVSPVLGVLVAIIVAERAIAFAISNPALRVLFTVVAPEDKYKAQNFIDTVVFRGGDAASGWIFNTLAKGLGLATPIVAFLTVPFALLWLWLSLVLGRDHEARAGAREKGAV